MSSFVREKVFVNFANLILYFGYTKVLERVHCLLSYLVN